MAEPRSRDAVGGEGRGAVVPLSVIIPTYNRPDELREALASLLGQTVRPREVIVVDDSSDGRVAELVRAEAPRFISEGSILTYARNPRERGAGIARNVGLEMSSSEFVLFTDDDVVLDPGYVAALMAVYRERPDAAGVQGHMMIYGAAYDVHGMYNALRRVFRLTYASERGCDVLRSFRATYPVRVDRVEECAWLSGTNQSFRREALGPLRYDENLRRYSSGEDLDLSFNVGRRGKGRLYITPDARLIHREAGSERTPHNRLFYVDAVYSYYLFRKNMPQTLVNRAVFCWSRLGRLMLNVAEVAKGRRSGGAGRPTMRHVAMSQLLWLSRRGRIASGDLSFLEEHLRGQGL